MILATGAQAKWLGLPSEEKFKGFGVQEVLDLWTANLACTTPAVITPINGNVEQQVYAPCNGNATVVHYKISGGGHTWPTGSEFNAINVIWYSDVSRLAYRKELKYPDHIPLYGDWPGFQPDTWWYEKD